MSEKINISALIRNKLDENQRSIAWLGQKVHREKSALAKMLKKYSIDTKLLFDISHALQFDFFYCYSKNLPFPALRHSGLLNPAESEYPESERERQTKIDIGALIRDKLIENQRPVAWLAQKTGSNRGSLGRLLKKDSMDTNLLFDISTVLRFDFFCCYSKILRNIN